MDSFIFFLFAAHIGFEQARYTTSEAEGSVTICISVLTGPVIESLTVTIHVGSNSATGKQSFFHIMIASHILSIYNLDNDFQFENTPIIEIPPGASRGCLVIAILSSPVVERDEEIHCSIDDNNIMAVVEDEATTVLIQHDGGIIFIYTTHFVQAVNGFFFQLLL